MRRPRIAKQVPKKNEIVFHDTPETREQLVNATQLSFDNNHMQSWIDKLHYLANYNQQSDRISRATLYKDWDNSFWVKMELFYCDEETNKVMVRVLWEGGLNYHSDSGWSVNT